MAGDKPISQLPENTSPNDNDFYYTSTPGTPRGDKFIRLSTLKEIFGYSKIHDQNTDIGTNSTDFTLGFGEDGTITLYFGEEGHAIRVNKESTPEVLEWTNDGVEWNTFGTGEGGSDPNAVQKSGFTPLTITSSVANLPLDDENTKFDSTLPGNFTYDHGTIEEGSNAIHNINTGAVSTAITITFDSAYTNVDGKGNEITTYELPAGTDKNYQVVFLVLPDDIILVTIAGVEEEEGSVATNLGTTYGASSVTITSDTGTDATIAAVNGTDPGVVTPTQKATWDAAEDNAKAYADGLVSAVQRSGSVVSFDRDSIYGTESSKITGNITFDFTGAQLGVVAYMIHAQGTVPTFPAQANIISGSYSTTLDNEIYFHYLSNTKVNVTIGQTI